MPAIRPYVRPPPPRVTLTGIITDVIEPESGSPLLVVRLDDGEDIECYASQERFYGEDAKHIATGQRCEVVGGDGGSWLMTRILPRAEPDPITTYVETGHGLLTIADDAVSIAHSDGDDVGLFSSGAGITRIAHSDEDTEAALAISVDGVSLWGPDAGLYTAQSGSPGARVDVPVGGTATNVAPDDGALIFGRVDEGGAAANSLPAYAVPMMLPGVTSTNRPVVNALASMPATITVSIPGYPDGSWRTADLFPDGHVGRLYLETIFQDVTRRLLVSGSLGARTPGNVNPTPILPPADFRILVAPQPLIPRAEAVIAYDASWRAPTGFQAGIGGAVYRITREAIDTVTAVAASVVTIVADYITLPSAAPRWAFQAPVVQGLEHVIRGTGEVPVIAAAIPSAAGAPLAGIDGAHTASGYSSGTSGATVYANRALGSDPAYAAVIVSQPGDAFASIAGWTRSGRLLTPTVNYAAFLAALGARVVNSAGVTVPLTAAQVSASRLEIYSVRARRLGINIQSPASGAATILTIVLETGFQFEPAP